MDFQDWPFIARFIVLGLFYLMLGWIVSGNEDAIQLCSIFGFLAAIFTFSKEIQQGHW
jgi:hypothetical protein